MIFLAVSCNVFRGKANIPKSWYENRLDGNPPLPPITPPAPPAPIPALTVSPNLLNFGSINSGMASHKLSSTFTNSGNAPTQTCTSSLSDSSNFSIVSDTCNTILNAGDSCLIEVVGTPVSPATTNGQLILTCSSLSDTASLAIDSSGLGTVNQIGITNGASANKNTPLNFTLNFVDSGLSAVNTDGDVYVTAFSDSACTMGISGSFVVNNLVTNGTSSITGDITFDTAQTPVYLRSFSGSIGGSPFLSGQCSPTAITVNN